MIINVNFVLINSNNSTFVQLAYSILHEMSQKFGGHLTFLSSCHEILITYFKSVLLQSVRTFTVMSSCRREIRGYRGGSPATVQA